VTNAEVYVEACFQVGRFLLAGWGATYVLMVALEIEDGIVKLVRREKLRVAKEMQK
jgi:hypothetical protein